MLPGNAAKLCRRLYSWAGLASRATRRPEIGSGLLAFQKRIWPEPRVRPSLNREASRLRDVGSEDPFPGASPGNFFGANQPRKSVAIKYRVAGISNFTPPITIGNWFWLVCKNRNAMRRASNCAPPTAADLYP